MINIEFQKENLIKSPLNYTGGKYKLLPQLLPLFPDNINTFVDLFTGGCNVGINVQANKIICNDIESHIIELLKQFKLLGYNKINKQLNMIISELQLSNTNKESYLNLRKLYNNEQTWDKFYLLICHSFNNQIRFNHKGKFNLPFGARTYNSKMKDNLSLFCNKISNKNIIFTNKDFKLILFDILKNNNLSNYFVYCDPPYSLNFKEYNGTHYWNTKNDIQLFNLLDEINKKQGKFALSNIFESKGKINNLLKEWSKKYNVYYLNNTYKNCNYIRKNIKDIEVLITNY